VLPGSALRRYRRPAVGLSVGGGHAQLLRVGSVSQRARVVVSGASPFFLRARGLGVRHGGGGSAPCAINPATNKIYVSIGGNTVTAGSATSPLLPPVVLPPPPVVVAAAAAGRGIVTDCESINREKEIAMSRHA